MTTIFCNGDDDYTHSYHRVSMYLFDKICIIYMCVCVRAKYNLYPTYVADDEQINLSG